MSTEISRKVDMQRKNASKNINESVVTWATGLVKVDIEVSRDDNFLRRCGKIFNENEKFRREDGTARINVKDVVVRVVLTQTQ